MTPAAPTRSEADVNATDPATAPHEAPAADETHVSEARSTTQDSPTTRGAATDSGRSADVAAMFDELAPVHDRLATLLSLVTIGDFASCYVGLRRGEDPTPVEVIQGLKAALAAMDLG